MEILFDAEDQGPWLDPSDTHYEYAIDAKDWISAAESGGENWNHHFLGAKDRSRALRAAQNLFNVWSYILYPDTGDALREDPKILFIPRPLFYGTEGFLFIFKADNNGNTYRFEFEADEFSDGAGSAALSYCNFDTILTYVKRVLDNKNEITVRRQNAKEKSEAAIQ